VHPSLVSGKFICDSTLTYFGPSKKAVSTLQYNSQWLGAVHKGRPQSRGEGCVQCEQGGFFRYGRAHFLIQKTPDFSKFMVSPHGQGELSQCGNFVNKRGGRSIFRDFVRTSFMHGSLSEFCKRFKNLS